jgi:hypothetical protein
LSLSQQLNEFKSVKPFDADLLMGSLHDEMNIMEGYIARFALRFAAAVILLALAPAVPVQAQGYSTSVCQRGRDTQVSNNVYHPPPPPPPPPVGQHPHSQISAAQQSHALVGNSLSYQPLQQVVVEPVEEFFQVDFRYPRATA